MRHLVIAFLGALGVLTLTMAGCPSLIPVRMPNLVGMEHAAAIDALNGAGLVLDAETESQSLIHQEGTVVDQAPATGAYVPRGTKVTIVISTGDGQGEGEAEQALPNVVVLCLDTLRDDCVGKFRNGEPVTPFLNSYAEEGIRFSRAYAPGGWTRPTLAAMFTGLYAETHRYSLGPAGTPSTAGFAIAEEYETMAEWFQYHGYETWCVQANITSGQTHGYAQGYPAGQYIELPSWRARAVTKKGIEFIEEAEEPFFLYMQYLDPHALHIPPPEYDEIFGPQPTITEYDKYVLTERPGHRAFAQGIYHAWLYDTAPTVELISENGEVALRYRYEADIRSMDDQLARFIAALEARYPNTVVMIFSDHGEALLDRDYLLGHAFSIYEELVRALLIVKGPGLETGVIDRPVELLGMLPALASYLGLPPNPVWEGLDFFDPTTSDEPIFTFTESLLPDNVLDATGVVLGDYKMLSGTRFPTPVMFNVVNDPGELQNLTAQEPGKTAELQALLDAHIATYAKTKPAQPFNGEDYSDWMH